MAEQVRPSRVWYFVGGLVAFVGVVGATIWVVVNIVNLINSVDDLQRVPVPGTGVVSFSDTGGYTVYLEGPGLGDENVPSGSGEIIMQPVGGGDAIDFTDYDSTFTYDWGGHEGRAVLTFEIDEPGRYRVRTEKDPGSRATGVALGRSIAGGIFTRVGAAIALAALAVIAAAVIITITAVRRHGARKAGRPPAAGGTYQYPPQQYPQQPYPPQPQYPPQGTPPSAPPQPPPAAHPGPGWVPPPRPQ